MWILRMLVTICHLLWRDSFAAYLVDFSSLGMAVLGLVVALSAPSDDQRKLKRFYVVSIIVLFAVGMFAGSRVRAVDAADKLKLRQSEQKATQSEEDARKQFESDLRDVKQNEHRILVFVTHPPKGLTLDQVSAVAKNMLSEKYQTDTEPILDAVSMVIQELQDQSKSWQQELSLQGFFEQRRISRATSQSARDAAVAAYQSEIAGINKKYSSQIKGTMAVTNDLRNELLTFVSASRATAEQQNSIYADVAAGKTITNTELQSAIWDLQNVAEVVRHGMK